jgi:hypothetical protein
MAVTFTKAASERIARAVRKVEGQGLDRGSTPLPAGPGEQPMWGYITGIDFGQDGLRPRYSFIRVNPCALDEADLKVDGRIGYRIVDDLHHRHAAIEVNGKQTPAGTVVQLAFTGYQEIDGERRAAFGFAYAPTLLQRVLPAHDHRDNVTGGGFAFAVYHPGTGLPQQPWAL